jgi:acetyl esterase/lipase
MPEVKLEPRLTEFLRQLHENHIDITRVPVEESRASALELITTPLEERQPIGPIWDASADGIPIRIYTPERDGPFPVLLFFHGGGWVLGSIEQSDQLCRRIVKESDCAVISVEYRLAPEHPFPAAFDDAYRATCWVAEHAEEIGCDPLRVGVGGASSGANLAIATSLRARDEGGPDIGCQLLIYPPTRFEMDRDEYTNCVDQDWLPYDKMRWFWDQYLPNGKETPNFAHASLEAFPNLENLPPALMVLAEHDPLTPEGSAFASRLKSAGNTIYEQLYSGVIHGFLEFPIPLPQTDLALQNIGVGLHRLFNA